MTMPLAEKLAHLYCLQDLDLQIAEAQDPEKKKSFESMGFRIDASEKLVAARTRLLNKIDPREVRLYERIAKRYPHAIVRVEDRICLGCFMSLPTSTVPPRPEQEQLPTCENCGRILYWPE